MDIFGNFENFLGGFFWEMFWEEFLGGYFGRNFLGGFSWEKCFGRNYLVEINKELMVLSRFRGNFVWLNARMKEEEF